MFPPRIKIVPVARHRRYSPRRAGTVCFGRAGRAELRIPSVDVPSGRPFGRVLRVSGSVSGRGGRGSTPGGSGLLEGSGSDCRGAF